MMHTWDASFNGSAWFSIRRVYVWLWPVHVSWMYPFCDLVVKNVPGYLGCWIQWSVCLTTWHISGQVWRWHVSWMAPYYDPTGQMKKIDNFFWKISIFFKNVNNSKQFKIFWKMSWNRTFSMACARLLNAAILRASGQKRPRLFGMLSSMEVCVWRFGICGRYGVGTSPKGRPIVTQWANKKV